jgi:hypothetical protein
MSFQGIGLGLGLDLGLDFGSGGGSIEWEDQTDITYVPLVLVCSLCSPSSVFPFSTNMSRGFTDPAVRHTATLTPMSHGIALVGIMASHTPHTTRCHPRVIREGPVRSEYHAASSPPLPPHCHLLSTPALPAEKPAMATATTMVTPTLTPTATHSPPLFPT